jgi:hypothetical protein
MRKDVIVCVDLVKSCLIPVVSFGLHPCLRKKGRVRYRWGSSLRRKGSRRHDDAYVKPIYL